MARKSKERSVIKRILTSYMFTIWPSLRFYYSLWIGYRKKKKEKREKVIVIEE